MKTFCIEYYGMYLIFNVVPLSTHGYISYLSGSNGEWYQRYVCVLGYSIRWLVLIRIVASCLSI